MFLRRVALAWALLPALLPVVFLWPALSGRLVPAFRDQSDFFYPSHRYTAARLLRREVPLWNSLSGNGESWIANGQNEIFYPPSLLFLMRNGARAAGLFLFFHFAASYLLFFGFLRARDQTVSSAAAGSALFSLSGAAVSLSIYWNHFAALAWLPALAWGAQLGLKTRRQRAGFGAALALTLLAGSPEIALFGLIVSALLFVLQWHAEEAARVETGDTRVRQARALAIAAVSGGLLSAIGLFPFLAALPRAAARSSIPGGGLWLAQLPSAIAAASLSQPPWLPAGSGFLQTLYVSLPVFAIAAAAFLLPDRRKEKLLWAGLAAAAVLLALLPARLPFRYPAKFIVLALFAVSLLAAEGFEALRFAPASRQRRLAAAGLAAATALAGLLLTRTPAEKATVAAAGALAALAALDNSVVRRGVALGLAAPLLAAHLAAAALPLPRLAPLAAFEKPPRAPHGKVLTSQDPLLSDWASAVLPSEESRVRRQVDSLEGYSNLPFGIAKARTASALPSAEEAIFARALDGAGNLTLPAAAAGCGEVRFPQGSGVARVLVSPTLSGAQFFFREKRATSPERALSEIVSGRFDFSRVVLVESPRGIRPSGKTMAVASTISEAPERVEYSVTLSRDAWLYRAQSWDPWWKARIDGRPVAIVRANGVFSAVFVPAGEHRVLWRYEPWPFYAGAFVSAFALLVVVGFSIFGEPPLRVRRS